MHDPMTVAFEIRRPWPTYYPALVPGGGRERYWPTLVTIWHVDPEKDGSDDSCGWFKRAKHGDAIALAEITRDFAFDWDASYGGWFDKDGAPLFSTPGIVLAMFRRAAYKHFGRKWGATDRFLRARLFDILSFAENTVDSMDPAITQKYGKEPRQERIEHAASVVYGCVLRWSQPWYRHPRWHLHHWQIQVHPVQNFKRWMFSRCAGCGKRFRWNYAPVSSSWSGGGPRWFKSEQGVYHHNCMPPPARRRAAGPPKPTCPRCGAAMVFGIDLAETRPDGYEEWQCWACRCYFGRGIETGEVEIFAE